MNKVICLLVLVAGLLLAQENIKVDTTAYIPPTDETFNEDNQQESLSVIGKASIGFGVIMPYVLPQIDEINKQMVPNFIDSKFSKNGFISYGFSGFIPAFFIPNVRIGGYGFGLKSTQNQIKQVGNENLEREVSYSYSSGGFTVEYTLPWIKHIGVSVGSMFGGGTIHLDINQNKTNFVWDNVFSGKPDDNVINRKVECLFMAVSPMVNIDIPIYNKFVAFRLGAAYNLDIYNKWTQDNDKELYNVPSKLNGNALVLSAGIFIGMFNF